MASSSKKALKSLHSTRSNLPDDVKTLAYEYLTNGSNGSTTGIAIRLPKCWAQISI